MILGEVSSIETGGLTVTIDGEDTPTTKEYCFLSSYVPTAGDRVLIEEINGTYVVLGKVVSTSGGGGETHADTADYATNAGHANTADTAGSATSAGSATTAGSADTATNATEADGVHNYYDGSSPSGRYRIRFRKYNNALQWSTTGDTWNNFT